MRAKEYLNESDNRQFVEKYIPWVADQLGIQDLPQIELLDAPIDTTFGQYNPEDKSLSLVIANRNPIDVLRTLAHELTHHKQNLEGKLVPGAGETGTPQENEANANAGVVMRDFAKANPEYFGLKKSSIDEEASKTTGEKKLVIFDIDDTLVTTKTKVGVVHNGKTVKQLDSHEFTHYKLKPGETFDFGAFRDAEDFFEHAQPIAPMIEQLKNDIATGNRVVMVTARADFNSKEIFLKTFEQWHVDMSQVHVYRAGNDTDPVPIDEKKARIIRRLLNGHAYNKAIMYDDSVPNLESFVQLHNEYPGVKFYAWHVDRKGHACEYTRGHRAKDIDETIRHVKGGYKVFSKKGKNLGGPYSSHKQAAKRLGQVEYFKHMHEDKDNGLYELCDYTLVELCAGIIQHQKQDADKYGLVAAAVIDPDHNVVASISTKEGGKWKHAERNAMEKYIKRHGAIPAHSIVVTTLSPCANRMSERHGPSCTELLNDSPITRVYAGYRDPSQTHLSHDDFDVVYTQNSKIESVCKQIADCFLKESAYTDPANYCGEGVAEGLEHYDGIEISMEKEADEIMVKAMRSGGRELGHVLFVIDGEYLAPQDLEVDERYRGQGIAQTMYDYVKSKGYKIRRSGQQTDAGAGFWDKHKGPGQNVWEQGVAENFADGKGPGRPGDSQRHGIPKHATMAELEKASHAKGRKGQLARWQLNMRRGHKK